MFLPKTNNFCCSGGGGCGGFYAYILRLKQLKIILRLWTIPKQTEVQIWPRGHSSLTLTVQDGREI